MSRPTLTVPAVGHMPFPGHRTQKQVREDEMRARHDQLPWCPPEYREQYHHIKDKCHFTAAEARGFIEKQIEVDRIRSARG